MRKLLTALALVFALAFTLGAFAPTAEAVGGGGGGLPSNCHYECSCTGTPLICCEWSGGEFCSVTDDIGCPQIITC